MGRFRREPAHCLCAAHQKRETQGGRGAAQQDEKAPEKIPAGGGHIKHPGQQGVPKGQAGGNGKEIEQDIAAAEEVDPPPPGIAAPIPKEGGDARQAQHGQKAHQAEVGNAIKRVTLPRYTSPTSTSLVRFSMICCALAAPS